MQTEKLNFKIEKTTLNSLKVLGLSKSIKTNAYDTFDEPESPASTPEPSPANPERKSTSSPNLEEDPRLNQYSRNNFNPDMLKSAPSQKSSPKQPPEMNEEQKARIKDGMDFMKNMLSLYQAVKGPMKKQALMLQDYSDGYYYKMVIGFHVETFEGLSDDFIKLSIPEGEYYSLTLTKDEIKKSPEVVKSAWKYLKDELSDKRSYINDFQIEDPLKKTLTLYVSTY